MGKDTGWKRFFSDNERYADLINGFGCGGEQIVQKEDLQEADVQTGIQKSECFVAAQKNRRGGHSAKQRDMVRKTAFGINFAVIGIEHQEEIDYKIPLRQMSYEAGEYEKQAAAIRKEVRNDPKGLSSGEYLYGFRKDSKLYPVITFILYTGEKEWNGPLYLSDIIDFHEIPDSLKEMVNDCRIHLLEIRKWDHMEVFQTDVRQVFEFIHYSKDAKKLRELVAEDPYYKEMDEDAFDVVVTYTKAEELVQVKDYHKKGGGIDMCEALTTLIEEGRVEGIELGRLEGENSFAMLTERLLQQNRTDDLLQAIKDLDYRKILYGEFDIK